MTLKEIQLLTTAHQIFFDKTNIEISLSIDSALKKILKEQKEEILKKIEGIEEWEETYCEKDEHLFLAVKKKLTNLIKYG